MNKVSKSYDELEAKVVQQAEQLLAERQRLYVVQESLLETRKEIERLKRLSDIGMLAATVAHELRNPLATITMAVSNIKRKTRDPLLDKHIESIENKISESGQIIDNLLFYSRAKVPDYENVDIDLIITECVQSLRPQSRYNKKISVIKNLNLSGDIFIEADSLQMKELMRNILNNSYDAITELDGKIEITGGFKGKFIEIRINDNGVGINKEHLEKVFEPFFSTKAKGTGLGLAVCRQIVNLHGGTIQIESELGKGTNICISLPKKRQ